MAAVDTIGLQLHARALPSLEGGRVYDFKRNAGSCTAQETERGAMSRTESLYVSRVLPCLCCGDRFAAAADAMLPASTMPDTFVRRRGRWLRYQERVVGSVS